MVIVKSCGIDRENFELGGSDQGVAYHDQSGFEGRHCVEVVRAQDLQVGDVLRIDLRKGRVVGSRKVVVHVQPVTAVPFADGTLLGSNRVRHAENDGGSDENSREPL